MIVKLQKFLQSLIRISFWTPAIINAGIPTPTPPITPFPTMSKLEIADELDWKTYHKPNLCGGYYEEPQIISSTPNPADYKDEPTRITAEGPTLLSDQGWSLLKQDVVLTQPGRMITADTAYIFHDKKTKQVTKIRLLGNVHLMEHGRLVITPEATLNLVTNEMTFNHALYHVSEAEMTQTNIHSKYIYDAWGTADYAYRDPEKILHLYHANYTTCSPLHPTWIVHARRMTLNKNTGEGIAHNTWVTIHHIPVMYTPYFEFPIDNRRKSGFLFPSYSHNTSNGYQIDIPYYWNIAPNYDALFSPTIMTYRGVQLGTLFRFLSEMNTGEINAVVLPDDQGYEKFKKTTLANPSPNIPINYYTDLKNTGNTRGQIAFSDTTVFDPNWTGHLNINAVTDPNYITDFYPLYISVTGGVSPDQLLNQADLDYSGLHWQWTGLAQIYQTLHNINFAVTNPSSNQFIRAPELDFTSEYPDLLGGLDFTLNGQGVNFIYDSAHYYPFTNQEPVGQRLHFQPALSRSFNFPAGYLKPSLILDSTSYFVGLPTTSLSITSPPINPGPRIDYEASRNLPIFDIDSGLYLENPFHFRNEEFIQTIEPRLFYLYVPYLNQNQYPVFDTFILPFSFDQLFSINRTAQQHVEYSIPAL